jgi:hypothetical protein
VSGLALEELLTAFSSTVDTDPGEAVRLWERVRAHPDWPTVAAPARLAALDDLAAACSATGDHDRAVTTAEAALTATPEADPDHPYRISCLAERVAARRAATGSGHDLVRLLDLRQEAVDRTSDDDPDLVVRLSALADAHRTRWRVAGDAVALDRALRALDDAVGLASLHGTDVARPAGNLAVVLADRFDAVGDPGDLTDALTAIALAQRSGGADHPDRGSHLTLHATLLSERFDQDGRLSDLRAALSIGHAALDAPLDDDRERARVQNLLGLLELDRFQIEGDPVGLDDAVRWARTATATTDAADPELPGYLTNLAAALRLAFEETLGSVDWSSAEDVELDVSGLRDALAAGRRAVELTAADAPDRARQLTNLGSVLLDAALVLPEEIGLDEPIVVLDEALRRTAADSPHRAGRANHLATALRARADRTGDPADLRRAVAVFRSACAGGARPEATLAAAVNWGIWATLRAARAEIAESAVHALDAADQLRRTQLTRQDRTSWLRTADGVATAGAEALARLGRVAEAVVVAERGRALLLSDALDRDRPRLDRLLAVRPDLARRLRAAAAAVRGRE